jgi:hypothetical protein
MSESDTERARAIVRDLFTDRIIARPSASVWRTKGGAPKT